MITAGDGQSLAAGDGAAKYRVNLVNPPSAPGTLANREGAAGMGVVYPSPATFCYPPHTIAVVASTLREEGHVVRAFDGVVGTLPADLPDADVIAVFVSFASLVTDLAFIRSLRQQAPAARLIAFGPAMRFVAEQLLSGAPVDAVLVGEAEGFCGDALRYLEGQTGPPEPRALTPRELQSSCCDAEGLVCDLDGLPFPAWELLPYENYQLLSVFASRGCPDSCAYCPYAAAQGHRLRKRSVDNVLAELSWLSERFRPSRLVFRDPVFAYDRDRVVALCEGMLQRQLRLSWECESRPEHFDAELLRLMQRAGCQWIKIGLETTDGQLLQELRRVGSAEEATAYLQHTAEVVQTCTSIELQCRVFVMAGLPGQDALMVQHTRHFLEQLRPTALNVKAFERYQGIASAPASAEISPEPCPSMSGVGVLAGEVEAQMAVLQQAQLVPRRRGLLARGKRWLRRLLVRATR